MKNREHLLNTLLAAVLGTALLVCLLLRTFSPAVVLPKLDIPNMALLTLVALVLDHYFAKGAKRCYVCVAVLSALTYGLLPLAAGFIGGMDALRLALVGGVVATVTTWLYTAVQERLSSGPAVKAAPILSALGLYLAFQCFAGIIV